MSSMDDHDYPETLSYNMKEDPSWGYKDFPTTHKALPCPSTTHKLYPPLPHPHIWNSCLPLRYVIYMLSLCQIIIILKSDLRFVDSHSIRNTKNKPTECLALGRNDAVYIQIPWIPTNSLFHPFIKMYSRRAYPWHTFCTTVSNVFQTKGQLNILAIDMTH